MLYIDQNKLQRTLFLEGTYCQPGAISWVPYGKSHRAYLSQNTVSLMMTYACVKMLKMGGGLIFRVNADFFSHLLVGTDLYIRSFTSTKPARFVMKAYVIPDLNPLVVPFIYLYYS